MKLDQERRPKARQAVKLTLSTPLVLSDLCVKRGRASHLFPQSGGSNFSHVTRVDLVSSVILRTWQLSLTSQWKWVGSVSVFFGAWKSVSCTCLWNYCFKESSSRITTLASCLSKAPAFIKPKEQSNDWQLASVFKLVPWSLIPKKEGNGCDSEKASTHSSSNIEMHGIIKGFDSRVRLGRQLLQGFDWHSEEDFPSKRRKDCEVLLPHQKGTAQLCHLARALKKKRLQLRRTNGEPHQKRLETKCELQSHSLQEKVVECVRRREYST